MTQIIETPNLNRKIVTFIGPEGSGKSTLAKKLASDCQKPYISTGDLIRDLKDKDTGPWGNEARAMFAEQRYFNPQMLLEVLAGRYRRDDMSDGFIVDGGLRTVPETIAYPAFLKSVGRDFPMTVVHLKIAEDEGIRRILEDRKRDVNDSIEGIKSRLARYNFQLDERLALISQTPNWTLIDINAMGSLDETYQKLCAAVNQYSKNNK